MVPTSSELSRGNGENRVRLVAVIASDERPGKFWTGKLTLVQESGAKGLPIIRERLCFEHSNESEELRHEEQDGRRGR